MDSWPRESFQRKAKQKIIHNITELYNFKQDITLRVVGDSSKEVSVAVLQTKVVSDHKAPTSILEKKTV